MLSGPNPLVDRSEWILRIRNILDAELEEEDEGASASIAGVPKPLMSFKAEAYIPQLIALGPYHHNREELHHMERYKITMAKKIRTRLPDAEFQHVVDLFCKVEYRIRAHYQRYLPFNDETLAWMMAIDTSFLLEFLQILSLGESEMLVKIPAKHNRCIQATRKTSMHDMLIRDIIMLENQLPLFLLLKILELQVKLPQLAEEALTIMLASFLNELTPFKKHTNFQPIKISSHSHLLELLYHLIVPSSHEEPLNPDEAIDRIVCPQNCSRCFNDFAKMVNVFVFAPLRSFILLLIKFFIKIPLTIITLIPTFSFLRVHIENIFNSPIDPNMIIDLTQQMNQMAHEGPSFDEIAIPSVTELANAGVRFEPTDGNVLSVAFDVKTATLHLPEINLDVNSEVVLRNLVAYEAAIVTGPLVFTRYVELMNGIIDTSEDAKLLREKGVLVNRLRSDDEVAELWNGMSRSLRLTNVKVLDKVIEEVNEHYNGKWKVKVGRFMNKHGKRYLVTSWESLVVVVVVLLIMVVGLQMFGLRLGKNWAYNWRGGKGNFLG